MSKISSQKRLQVYRLQLLKSDRTSPVLPEKINGSENEEPKYNYILLQVNENAKHVEQVMTLLINGIYVP